MDSTYTSYSELVKPLWSPPAWIFAPVWTVLYILIAISFGSVFQLIYRKKLKQSIAIPFVLNLIFNFSFTYFQFGLKNNYLAAADILLTLITLIWAMLAIYPKKKWIFYIQVPYLLWVAFATILQLTVTYLNR